MDKPEPKYEEGRLVRLKDGDGRPHQIKRNRWLDGLHSEGWWQCELENGGVIAESELAPFIDKHLLDMVCEYLDAHLQLPPFFDTEKKLFISGLRKAMEGD